MHRFLFNINAYGASSEAPAVTVQKEKSTNTSVSRKAAGQSARRPAAPHNYYLIIHMKKTFTLLAGALAFCTATQAQQINGSFDKQTIWDASVGGTVIEGWDALNVVQMGFAKYALAFTDKDHAEPDNADKKSVLLHCKFLGIDDIGGSNSPSYMTLGKTWVYADIKGVMSGGSDHDDSDGGSQGGIAFTARPDSIAGYFKRTHGTEKPDEVARIIVYSWKGTTTSDAPANKGSFDDMTTSTEDAPRQTLTDRDIDILGREASGKPADGITLVSNTDTAIAGDIEDWKRIAIPLNYLTDDTPEKLNVIISSANYWDRSAIGADNKLWADDVRLIYNAKLKSLSIDGQPLADFDEDTFAYSLPATDAEKEISATAWGQNATVNITTAGNVKTITVTDETSKGQKTYTYTITFAGEATVITTPETAPTITYGDEAIDLGFKSNSTAAFTYQFSDEGVLEVRDGKLVAVGSGTVKVKAYQAATEEHSAASTTTPLSVTVSKAPLTVALADTVKVMRGQRFSSSDAAYVLTGLKLGDDTLQVSDILTTMPSVSGPAPESAEQVGDKRAITISGGEAKNYELAYADVQTATVVKNEVSVYVGYASNRFNALYDGENYHVIKVAAGQESYDFNFLFMGTAYDDEEVLAKLLPTDSIKCAVDKASAIGETIPVRLNLPDASNTDFTLKSILPTDARIVVAKAPTIGFAALTGIAYGSEPFTLASTDDGVSLTYKVQTSDVIKVSRGTATVLKAGHAAVLVTSAAKGDFGATSKLVEFDIAKAGLTITAENDTITVDDDLPTTFTLNYAGFVNGDTIAAVFPNGEPTASVNIDKIEAGTYPIKISLAEQPENYDVTLIEGTLVVNVSTGIGHMNANGNAYTYNNGVLTLPAAGAYSVYTADGRLIKSGSGATVTLPVNAAVYIVKTAQGAFRLIAK